MSKTIAIAGTFDTKGKEFLYVKGLAEELGITPYMIHTGVFAPAFLDLTTTEWCDELVGGVLSAGSTRCEAAIKCKIPQVVSVGACDMVNFGPMDTIPEQFSSRNLYKHNPTVTLMRTTVREFPYNAVVELVNPVADTVSRKTYTGADVDWYVKAEDIVLKNKGNQNAGSPQNHTPQGQPKK